MSQSLVTPKIQQTIKHLLVLRLDWTAIIRELRQLSLQAQQTQSTRSVSLHKIMIWLVPLLTTSNKKFSLLPLLLPINLVQSTRVDLVSLVKFSLLMISHMLLTNVLMLVIPLVMSLLSNSHSQLVSWKLLKVTFLNHFISMYQYPHRCQCW